MEKQRRIFYILMFLPLPVTLISLVFLPDQIPAHYGSDNQVTRWGSKYETLIFPVVTIIFGLFMLEISKFSANQEKAGEDNEKVSITAGIFSLLIFNAMTGYFLYTDFNKIEDLSSVPIDIYQLIFVLLGIFMIVIGNMMPKLQMNSAIGLRTHWSMKNEIMWEKSQRFGRTSSIIAGILLILACCFTKGFACFMWFIGVLILYLLINVFYTYKVAKKY